MPIGVAALGWLLFGSIAVWSVPALLWFLLRELKPVKPVTPVADCVEPFDAAEFVSIIVPACNEQSGIQAALRSLLKTEGISFQVIAVNDRSTDDTGRLMDEVASADQRCKVVHVEKLPDGWLGKNHAMHIAAQQAISSVCDSRISREQHFLLFTDGDVVYQPLAVASAVAEMRKRNLQHLCLLPQMLPGSAMENSVVAFFGLTVAIGQQVHLMPTRWPLSYAGVGAFNMVTLPMYESIDGHTRIAMDVLDDIKLGKLVRQHSGKQDLLAAPKLLSLRWYDNLWAVITGLEKNGFAALCYSALRLVLVTVLFITTMMAPYPLAVCLPWPDAAGYAATVVLWQTMFAAVTIKFCHAGSQSLAKSILTSLLFPFAAILMAFAFYRSAWKTWRQGGVQWRTTFYDLNTLKRNIYQ
ncbi:MAG: glycosyltransferase family 2 protein [Fuerstiella sp.]